MLDKNLFCFEVTKFFHFYHPNPDNKRDVLFLFVDSNNIYYIFLLYSNALGTVNQPFQGDSNCAIVTAWYTNTLIAWEAASQAS